MLRSVFLFLSFVFSLSVLGTPLRKMRCSALLSRAEIAIEQLDLFRRPATGPALSELSGKLGSARDQLVTILDELTDRAQNSETEWPVRVRAVRTLIEIASREPEMAFEILKELEIRLKASPTEIDLLTAILLIPIEENISSSTLRRVSLGLGFPSVAKIVYKKPHAPRDGKSEEGTRIFESLLAQIKRRPIELLPTVLQIRDSLTKPFPEDLGNFHSADRVFFVELVQRLEGPEESLPWFAAEIQNDECQNNETVREQFEKTFKNGALPLTLPYSKIPIGNFTFELWLGSTDSIPWNPQGSFYFSKEPSLFTQRMEGHLLCLEDESGRLLGTFSTEKNGKFVNLSPGLFRVSRGKVFLTWIK